MDFADYGEFFYAIANEMVIDKSRYLLLKSCGIRPREWPECEARFTALSFEEKLEAKGFEYASSVVYNQVFSKRSPEVQLPRQMKDVVALYQEYRTFGVIMQLSERLKRDPLDGHKILAKFRTSTAGTTEIVNFHESLASTIINIEARIKSGEAAVEIPEWPVLSLAIGGFNPQRVFIVTARTGVGKTSLALNLALQATKKMAVLFFNMEMSVDDINTRLLQIGSGVSGTNFLDGNYVHSLDKITSFVERTKQRKKLLITTGRSLTLEQIGQEVMRRTEDDGVGLAIVDYDQKIKTSGKQEQWQMLHQAVEELEEIAKAANIPIILLAQADEDGNPRASRRTAQVASSVIHFDESQGEHVLHIKKNRFGQNGAKIAVRFDKSTQRMSEVGPYVDKLHAMDAASKVGQWKPAVYPSRTPRED